MCQNAELGPVLQCECFILFNDELDVKLSLQCEKSQFNILIHVGSCDTETIS